MTEHRALQPQYRIRSDLGRKVLGDVACPLGVFPAEPRAELSEGFESNFIMGDDGFEDQCEYRIVLSSERLVPVVHQFLSELLPAEGMGLYEEFSFDAFRETDTWCSREPLPRERILLAWETYGEYFAEDGKCGFGARAEEPLLEIFLEEHGALYVACGLELREKVEGIIGGLGIREQTELRCIESWEHQHRDILDLGDNSTMDDLEIKFSVLESLGMEMSNRDEKGPEDGRPLAFWVYLELDLSLAPDHAGLGGQCTAFQSFGVTASEHAEAHALVESRILESRPYALIVRVIQIYRMTEADIGDDISPVDRSDLKTVGIWFESAPEYWGSTE
ncbi:MAG: hypothetical protein KDB53_04950, partial [Planctomycetes bacterium]|nr:hypothetical protein [Planctomycetota bacterium]